MQFPLPCLGQDLNVFHPLNFVPPVTMIQIPVDGLPQTLPKRSTRRNVEQRLRFFGRGYVATDLSRSIAQIDYEVFTFVQFLQDHAGDLHNADGFAGTKIDRLSAHLAEWRLDGSLYTLAGVLHIEPVPPG